MPRTTTTKQAPAITAESIAAAVEAAVAAAMAGLAAPTAPADPKPMASASRDRKKRNAIVQPGKTGPRKKASLPGNATNRFSGRAMERVFGDQVADLAEGVSFIWPTGTEFVVVAIAEDGTVYARKGK
jgi:hypothetical protein